MYYLHHIYYYVLHNTHRVYSINHLTWHKNILSITNLTRNATKHYFNNTPILHNILEHNKHLCRNNKVRLSLILLRLVEFNNI